MAKQGKTLHELQTLGLLGIADRDLVLIGDISDPKISKATTVNELRVTLGAVVQSDATLNPDLEIPTWVVEGERGYWKISVLSAIEGAVGYYIWFYNEGVDDWVLYPKPISETRASLGMAGGPLVLNVYVVRDDEGIAPRTYRRFKIQTITCTEQSPFSAEKSAYSLASLPATFVPAAPTLVDDETYPYTEAQPKYGQYSHSVVLLARAATDEADYIEHYELQRRPYVEGQSDKAGWNTLPMHTLILDPQKPAPSRLIYTDDSAKAAPGDVLEYRVRAVAITGDTAETPSAWSDVVTYTVENDDTAPDAPVLTVWEKALGFQIIFADPTQNEGDPCKDWWYFKLFYSTNGGEDWDSVLDPKDDGKDKRITNQVFDFSVKDADLDLDYIFRAKTFDWSGNSSEFSAATSPTNPDKLSDAVMNDSWSQRFIDVEDGVSSNTTLISQNADEIVLRATKTYVDGQDTTLQGQITVNAGNINLKVSKNSVINEINISTEGIRIAGENLSVDADTTFAADVEIQGILKSTGGLKSGSETTRIEFGSYGSTHRILFYDSDSLVGKMEIDGGLVFRNYDGSSYTYVSKTTFGHYNSSTGKYDLDLSGGSTPWLKFYETGGSTYQMRLMGGSSPYLGFSNKQVLGPRLNGITKPAGGATVDTEARAAIDKIIDRLRATGGHGAIEDTES